MNKILEYLKLEKLGTTVLPPFEEFEGLMAARVSRRNSESFVVAKWNPEFLCPDVAFDPNTSMGQVDEFLELYNYDVFDESDFEANVDEDVDTLNNDSDKYDNQDTGTIHLVDAENDIDVDIIKSDIEFVVPEVDEISIDGFLVDSIEMPEIQIYPKEIFPIFESLKSDELSEWLLAHGISHKSTLSKSEKVKLCEKYVADLEKSE